MQLFKINVMGKMILGGLIVFIVLMALGYYALGKDMMLASQIKGGNPGTNFNKIPNAIVATTTHTR